MKIIPLILAAALMGTLAVPPSSQASRTALENPQDEARAQEIISQLQCFICQGQPLSQSQTPLAIDLKALIRDKVSQGESSQDIILFLSQKYGRAIMLNPPLVSETILLWGAPFLALLIGALLAARFLKRSANKNP